MTTDEKMFRSGIIGLGFIGAGDPISAAAIGQRVVDLDGTHAEALAANPRVQLVAGSSRDKGRRERFEERRRCKTFADWRVMLAQERLDIVSVATNSPFHSEITSACAMAGVRAVLCEKPIATRLVDADRAIRNCHEQGTILLVNHNRRWHPLWRAVRNELQQGTIGEIHHLTAHWSTGRLGNIGTHMFDALRMLLGAEATSVSGVLDPILAPDCRGPQFRDPGGWGVITFSNGVKAFVDASQTATLPFGMRIVGSFGQLSIRKEDALIELWNGKSWTVSTPTDGRSSMDRAVDDIVRCLTHDQRPASTGGDGLAALEMIIGFHVSDQLRGQRISLPIAGRNRELEVRIG